jgi:phosphoserine aminotransferase
VGSNYHVLLLQGGATQQFSMVPMTLLRGKVQAAELPPHRLLERQGSARSPARRTDPHCVERRGGAGSDACPGDDELSLRPMRPTCTTFPTKRSKACSFTGCWAATTCPASATCRRIFSRGPCAAERFSLIYAHAQKNIGPAGVTVVVVKDELLQDNPADLPGFLDYRTQIQAHSNFNTPPVFAIYTVLLVTRWLLAEIGGLDRMAAINRRKAEMLYDAVDASEGFYLGRAARQDRSLMNVTFNLATPALERRFLERAQRAGFSGLGGHRAIGGIRASIYNALTLPAVEKLGRLHGRLSPAAVMWKAGR